jgi:hypothetical protein
MADGPYDGGASAYLPRPNRVPTFRGRRMTVAWNKTPQLRDALIEQERV